MAFEPQASRLQDADLVDRLDAMVRRAGGEILVPGTADFEKARRIYNRLHNPRPLALVRSLDPDLLAEVAHLCDAWRRPLAVRGGGHHIGGSSGGDGGVVMDFSSFRRVDYCPRTQICRVQPGARLADVDRELARFGRVIPTGTVSDTGIAGLTLGGGIGWLTGPLGLTCDHLIGADILLADGQVVRGEETAPYGLLWALRGGGGAGVVLELRFRTALLPATTAGTLLVRKDIAASLTRLFDYLRYQCPRELTVAPVLGRDGDGPFLSVGYCSAGQGAPGVSELASLLPDAILAPFEGSFAEWQAHIDADFLPPQRGYWKACYLRDIPEPDVSTMIEIISSAPSHRCSILVEHLHGAFAEADERSSAFPLRTARFGILLAARWPHADGDGQNIGWVREGYSRLDADDRLPVYANYASAQDPRAASSFSAEARTRLQDLRARYDFAGLARRPGAPDPDGQAGAAQ